MVTVVCGHCGKRYRYQHRCKKGGGVQKVQQDSFQVKLTMTGITRRPDAVVIFEDV